jgi:hypothetical protein
LNALSGRTFDDQQQRHPFSRPTTRTAHGGIQRDRKALRDEGVRPADAPHALLDVWHTITVRVAADQVVRHWTPCGIITRLTSRRTSAGHVHV